MRTFSEEFKVEAVNLVIRQGVTISQASKDLGLSITTLRKWLHGHQSAVRAFF